MRDVDRWKDKVELTLDGRQIFFLFFGGAVVACMLFVVGVLVGKRLESRALAMSPAAADPLSALDQLGDVDPSDEELTYHRALTGKKARPEPVAVAAAPAPEVAKPRAEEPAVEPARPAPAMPLVRPQVVAAAAPKNAGKADASALHFTLQLSAFPEKSDAEGFMRKMQSLGYRPFLVASEVPGKGVFYRVRIGDYASKQGAQDAKLEFERKQHLSAYVARL